MFSPALAWEPRWRRPAADYGLMGSGTSSRPSEMRTIWRDLPRAVANTRTICERCEFTLSDLGYRFPDYPLLWAKRPTLIYDSLPTAARESAGVEP